MKIIEIINKLRVLLSRHQKIRIIELGVLMIVGGFVEMLSVTMIYPFVEAVTNPDDIMSNEIVSYISGLLSISDSRTFLAYMAISMAIVYILKNLYLLFQILIQNKFTFTNRFYTQRKLLNNYLKKPYEYFLSIKSGEVLQVIVTDTESVFNVLSTFLLMASELVVVFVLIITVFIVSPQITVGVAFVMMILVLLIQGVIRPILDKEGRKCRQSASNIQHWIVQIVYGIKDLKVHSSERHFENEFNKSGSSFAKGTYIYNSLINVPRFLIEAVSMASFFCLIGFYILRGVPFDTLVPVLSCIAVAAVRLLPAVNRITQCYSTMLFYEPALDALIEKLIRADDSSISDADCSTNVMEDDKNNFCFDDSIEMKDVFYKYPQGEKNVLSGANLLVKKGQSIGIVGSSGSGKSTVVDILLGLLCPQSGAVLVDGKPIHDDLLGWYKKIGYIPQNIFMLDGDIRSNVAFGEDKIDDERVWRALKEASIDEFVHALPEGINTQIGERGVRLSGGQRQRLGIARALYFEPEILFLDEATSALDVDTEKEIMRSIDALRGNKTVIIITHRLSTIENCDTVYSVKNGIITKNASIPA